MLLSLPDDILFSCFFPALSFREIGKLNRAMCGSRWHVRWRCVLREILPRLLNIRHVYDRDIRWISRYINVQCVHIRRNRFADMCAINVAYHCPQLHTLTLQGTKQGYYVCSTTVMLLAEKCILLKHLSLTNLTSLRDCAIEAIANHCHVLESLDIHGCFEVTDGAMLALADGCPFLLKLNINDCTRITDIGIVTLSVKCTHLSSLSCETCSRITEVALRSFVVARASVLVSLHCNFCQTSNSFIWDIVSSSCMHLRSLQICNCVTLTDEALCAVAKACPQLANLNLDYCTQLTDVGIIGLARHCSGLTDVTFEYCSSGITDEAVSALARYCYGIVSFCAAGYVGITNCSVIPFVQRHTRLRCLSLGGCSISDDGVIAIAKHCPLIEELMLFGNINITDVGVSALVVCLQLRELRLSCCDRLTDRSITSVAHACRKLQVVSLPRCSGITVQCLNVLHKYHGAVVEMK